MAIDYSEDAKTACKSVLIELMHILNSFDGDIAVVGGWVPSLLIPNALEKHIGTTDIDLALNHLTLSNDTYKKIEELLIDHGYSPNSQANAQFKYFKDISTTLQTYTVEVDLLTGEYGTVTGKDRRHEPVQDVKALKARGIDLVFSRTETVIITGELPNKSGTDTVKVRIAGIVPFIVLKGIALEKRIKTKDAYDLEYVIYNYPGGVDAIAELFQPDLDNLIVKEALSYIQNKFHSVDSYGPTSIMKFLNIQDSAEREILQRKSYETVNSLLHKLGFQK